jgi:P-type Cu+ transporter
MSICVYCKAPFKRDSLYCCNSCELLSKWTISGEAPITSSFVSEKWNKYRVAALESSFNLSKCPLYKKFRFYIDGLQCASCVHLLEDFPAYCHGVSYSRINYGQHILDVETKNYFSLAEVCQAVEQLGYTPTPLKEDHDYEQASVAGRRTSLKRIGVAGAIAGNLMLFSIPNYAGLTGNLGIIFEWLSLVLFLPILFYSAVPFYKKSWSGLLTRQVSVDMMVVVALWSGFLFSTYSLIVNLHEIYFDSTASFIFLILLTRYLLQQYKDKTPQKNIFENLFDHEVYELRDQKNQYVTASTIQPEQDLYLKVNQLVPCDSLLESAEADFDLSFLTGEAYPQKKHKKDFVLAGSRLSSVSAILRAQTTSLESQLAQSLNKIDFDRKEKNKIQTLSDKVSHRLTWSVFLIAGLFFVLNYDNLGMEAFKRCLALITIACPCAVAFGTPLAHSLGLKKAQQKGFFIKSDALFEKIFQVDKIIFDKTGTLTSSELKLIKTFPEQIDFKHKSIILGLEKMSLHPVALSLKKEWSDIEMASIGKVIDIVGHGVEAEYQGQKYRLVKSQRENDEDTIQVEFSKNGQVLAYLYFEEKIHEEASMIINEFQKRDYEVMMLTGDHRSRAIKIAKEVGIRPSCVFSDQSAASKKTFVENRNPCLYIGDGLNDLPALNSAYVSFAVRGQFDSTLKVSDIYAPQKNLNAILEIFEISKKIQSTLKANLFFAVLYNTIGGILALLGLVNPLVAAVLMPISSVIITLHTVGRLK